MRGQQPKLRRMSLGLGIPAPADVTDRKRAHQPQEGEGVGGGSSERHTIHHIPSSYTYRASVAVEMSEPLGEALDRGMKLGWMKVCLGMVKKTSYGCLLTAPWCLWRRHSIRTTPYSQACPTGASAAPPNSSHHLVVDAGFKIKLTPPRGVPVSPSPIGLSHHRR